MADFDFTQPDFEDSLEQVKWNRFQYTRRKQYETEENADGTITVTVTTDDDEEFTCLYPLYDREKVYELLTETEAPNLKGIYVKDFDISAIMGQKNTFQSFDASYSFWDGNVNFKQVSFKEGKVDFSEASFGEGLIDFSEVDFGDGDVSFRGASLNNGDLTFSGARFGKGDVYFSYAVFGEGDIDFSKVNFEECDVFFSYAIFADGDVSFYETFFGTENVSFRNTVFGEGSVSFRKMQMKKGHLEFDSSKFKLGNIAFDECLFPNTLLTFDSAVFEDNELSFLDAVVDRLIFMNVTFNANVNLELKSCGELTLQHCTIEKAITCNTCRFNMLSFVHTVNLGQIHIDWEKNVAWQSNGVFGRIAYNRAVHQAIYRRMPNAIESGAYYEYHENRLTSRVFTAEEKTSQFRMLKENFNEIGQYQDEDLAYRTYMNYKTKSIKPGLEKAFYKIFGFVGGYGTRPISIVFSTAGTIALFGMLYALLLDFRHFFSRVLGWMYQSSLIFFTIGTGHVSTSFTKLLSGAESFIGVVLMAYLTVALFRKLLR